MGGQCWRREPKLGADCSHQVGRPHAAEVRDTGFECEVNGWRRKAEELV